MILRVANVLTRRPVTAQPKGAFDPTQIKAFWKFIILREYLRSNNDRPRLCPILPDGLSQEPLGLVKELEPEMWPKLQRTQAQSKANRAFEYVRGGGPLRKAEISHAKLHGPQVRNAHRR